MPVAGQPWRAGPEHVAEEEQRSREAPQRSRERPWERQTQRRAGPADERHVEQRPPQPVRTVLEPVAVEEPREVVRRRLVARGLVRVARAAAGARSPGSRAVTTGLVAAVTPPAERPAFGGVGGVRGGVRRHRLRSVPGRTPAVLGAAAGAAAAPAARELGAAREEARKARAEAARAREQEQPEAEREPEALDAPLDVELLPQERL